MPTANHSIFYSGVLVGNSLVGIWSFEPSGAPAGGNLKLSRTRTRHMGTSVQAASPEPQQLQPGEVGMHEVMCARVHLRVYGAG
jgi:hypothetical protein